MSKLRKFWRSIGPGFVTGASDDDPSGIVTYSIAGAKFGFATLWLALITVPFMIVIQEMCGRIGLVTGKGLIGNMKKHHPSVILFIITLMVVIANIINIGANIAGMSTAFNIVVPLADPSLFAIIISSLILTSLVIFSYHSMAKTLKWLALILFTYIAAAFVVDLNWVEIFKNTIIPHLSLNKDYLLIVVAILGTTISPYLFFWQASEEVELERSHVLKSSGSHIYHKKERSDYIMKNEIKSMKKDTRVGMFFSNIIMYFVIILSASTLFKSGEHSADTIREIAMVLEPIAGEYSSLLFLIGVMGAGILAIPVLAGSAAYALSEVFGWKEGMNQKFMKAPQFYVIIIASTLLGLIMPALGVDAVKALLYTAVIYGVITPFLILLVLQMSNDPRIMGKYINSTASNIGGGLLFIIMAVSIVALVL